MPKEWILNQANMRWGLTKKNKVGAVSDEIDLTNLKMRIYRLIFGMD